MTYRQALTYLESFVNYEKLTGYSYRGSLRLAHFKKFLSIIGNPQESIRCIHVAGSKGKGSTCAFTAYILREAGYRVGLYTSPHLSDFRERIRVLMPQKRNGRGPVEFEGMISKKDIAALVERLKPAIAAYGRLTVHRRLSFFEVYTALAFLYFQEKKVDFVALETGLGGRLDATNLARSLVPVITPISYEHTHLLGATLRQIAAEKAGIIKLNKRGGPGLQGPVICAPQTAEALGVIRQRARKCRRKLIMIGTDVVYKKENSSFKIRGAYAEYKGLRTQLVGDHQLDNASCAIAAVEALRFFGTEVAVDSVRKGIYNTLWPARCEVVNQKPLVVIDGAQNVASCQALAKAIRNNFSYRKLILVLGVSSDKDALGMCACLYPLADEVILTKADNPRARAPEELTAYFEGKDIYSTTDVAAAKQRAMGRAGKKDLILVAGSLFVAGEMRRAFSAYR